MESIFFFESSSFSSLPSLLSHYFISTTWSTSSYSPVILTTATVNDRVAAAAEASANSSLRWLFESETDRKVSGLSFFLSCFSRLPSSSTYYDPYSLALIWFWFSTPHEQTVFLITKVDQFDYNSNSCWRMHTTAYLRHCFLLLIEGTAAAGNWLIGSINH